jgi:hypothetical protein
MKMMCIYQTHYIAVPGVRISYRRTFPAALPQELEQQHEGQHILLVSHGDTLSILQATFHGTPQAQHRQYGLGTAELKQLNGSGGSRQAALASEAEAGISAAAAEAVVTEPVCKPELVLSAASS